MQSFSQNVTVIKPTPIFYRQDALPVAPPQGHPAKMAPGHQKSPILYVACPSLCNERVHEGKISPFHGSVLALDSCEHALLHCVLASCGAVYCNRSYLWVC